ncbi:hypothetical protein RFG81_002593 [Klebsiella aerogenes]|nr:hypothetical protein [Klebsiella aerogenes]
MIRNYLSEFLQWVHTWEWGNASDVIGAVANVTMAIAAVWGVKTAKSWVESKAHKAADDVFDELHSLYSKYYKVYNLVQSGYETVCRMYGLHKELNPKAFSPYDEMEKVTANSIECYELLSSLKDRIRRSFAVKTKYQGGSGHIDFVKLLLEHDVFFRESLNFLKLTRKVIAQQHEKLDQETLEDYQIKFDVFDHLSDEILKKSQDIKTLKISDIFEIK